MHLKDVIPSPIKYSLFLLATLILISGCGNKKTPTGGKKDIISPSIIEVSPDEYSDLDGQSIEIVFSKPIERSTVTSGIRIYPEVFNKKFRWSKNTLFIQFLEPLKEDTNYFLNLTTRIQGEHDNKLDKDYIYVFASGKLQENKISGMIYYEDPEDMGKDINCRLSAADSTLIYSTILAGRNYEFENLNSNGHIIECFIDKNNNNLYDYGEDAYFKTEVPNNPFATVNLQIAYEDTIKPFLKSASLLYTNQVELTISENIKFINDISLFTADSLVQEHEVLAFDNFSKEEKYGRINLLVAPLDTLRYYVVAEDMRDFKDNITVVDTLLIEGRIIPDSIAPEVVSISPRNGASINSLKPKITVVFSEIVLESDLKIEMESIEEGNIIDLEIIKSNSSEYIVQPVNNLKNLASYKLNIRAADSLANVMSEPYDSIFIVIVR